MGSLSIELGRESLQPDDTVRKSDSESLNSATENSSEASSGSITVVLAPIYCGIQRIQILHENTVLQICYSNLKVRFGISTKFVDYAARLNFVMDACDSLGQRMSLDSGSTSDWRPVVTRKAGFVNSPTIRLHLPTVAYGNTAR